MKLMSVFRKTLREQVRDPLTLSLTLGFASFFVFLYWLFFPGGFTTYSVMVLNQDHPVEMVDGSIFAGGEALVEALGEVTYAGGNPLLEVILVAERAQAEALLEDRQAEVALIIPPDFSAAIQSVRDGQDDTPTQWVTFIGDLTNPYYAIAAVLANAALEQYVQIATGQPRPIQVLEQPLGASAARTEFELYIPGLFVFAMIMLVFGASMSVAREIEAGTLRRLQITRMSTFELLGGISAALILIGIVGVLLTFTTALALGFRSQGPLWVAVLVCVLTGISIVGTGLVVASFSRSLNQAFMIANFPLMLFMFFSGAVFPVPRVPLFNFGTHTVGLYDILPPTHAVSALNKIFTLGSGFSEVAYELSALAILSAGYFVAGIWLFRRNHMHS